MRLLSIALMAVCAFTFGCTKPTETVPNVAPTSGTTGEDHSDHDHGDHEHAEGEDHDHGDESASTEGAEMIRFVADTKFEVPGMMCPYSCFPAVKETLASMPGVEGVQLAEQPEGTPEGTIETKVVELKLNGDFDADAAIAALKKAEFDASVLN